MINFDLFNRFFVLIIFFLLISCGENHKETENGFPFQIHSFGDGDKVTYENYIYTWFSITTKDTVIFTTNEPEGKRIFLTKTDKSLAKIKDPIVDVLPFLSVGDSATLTVPVNETLRLSDNFKDVEELYYNVVVKSIETPEDRKKTELEEANQKADVSRKNMQRRSEEMQALPEASMAYQSLRTNIAVHSSSPDLQKAESGLEYIIIDEGKKPLCQEGNQVSVHYIGMQDNGLVFDETYTANTPFNFVLNKGRVIKAWDEAVQLLGVNGEAFLKVSPKLGYGATGHKPFIEPDATLFFHIKVVEVK